MVKFGWLPQCYGHRPYIGYHCNRSGLWLGIGLWLCRALSGALSDCPERVLNQSKHNGNQEASTFNSLQNLKKVIPLAVSVATLRTIWLGALELHFQMEHQCSDFITSDYMLLIHLYLQLNKWWSSLGALPFGIIISNSGTMIFYEWFTYVLPPLVILTVFLIIRRRTEWKVCTNSKLKLVIKLVAIIRLLLFTYLFGIIEFISIIFYDIWLIIYLLTIIKYRTEPCV